MNQPSPIRTIQPEDLFRLKFPLGAVLSPDGAMAAYSIQTTDIEKDEDREAIWLCPLETGHARQLTAGQTRDSKPAWSPDGKHIAFLSLRGDKRQIHLIPIDGGEARPLTVLKQGVGSGPVWSPDGKFIAFTAVPTSEPPDAKAPYRITRHVYRFDDIGYLEHAAQDIYIIPVDGGDPRRLTDERGLCSDLRWSPDGDAILYLSSMTPGDHWSCEPTLKVVDLNGAAQQPLGDWGYTALAAWTPDGERIVFIGYPKGRHTGGKADLYVVNRAGGEPENRTAGLKFGLGSQMHSDLPSRNIQAKLLIAPDGQNAYAPVQVGGTVPIYRIALTGPEAWTPVIAGARSCWLLDGDARRLLFAASTQLNPMDVFIADLDGAHERPITRLNEELLSGIALPVIERLSFSGGDGAQVEGWLMKPPIGEPPYPTILHIHGGPHAAYGHVFYFDYHMYAGAGYAVLFINHRGSAGYGDDFTLQSVGDWGNLDYKDLMAGVDHVIEQGWADANRLGCCGISGGGNLSCWIVGQTDRFRAAVPENPVTNLLSFYGTSDIGPTYTVEEMGGPPWEIPEVYRQCSPITYAHRCKTPTLLLQHEHDWRCPAEQSEQFYAVLKANACIVEMVRFPNSSHGGHARGRPMVRRAQNEAQLDWMNRYVLGIEPNT